jgi:hypothetical protein
VIITIVVIYLIVSAGLIMRAVLTRSLAHARYHERIRHAPPQAVIGQGGLYHEDQGFISFRGLRDVRFKPRSKSRGAKVEFDLFRRATRYTISQEETYAVYVPSGQEEEAKSLVARVRASKQL